MRFAIDLDCQAALKTGEIDDVSPARKLAAEAQALGPFPQLLPEHNFGQRQLAAEPASEADILV